ncbi:MAG: aminotransferase class III-fold pyridoxal phosphate-dependent enzyme, partial [Planctomycetales bacterium]|nr:aminotransferase class III-fold pyridoxal phosphate-dependent enzyme [Planctomycetales bacterium]
QRLAAHPHVGDIRQRGLIAGIELVRDRAARTPFDWQERRGYRVCEFAIQQGVWIRPLGNVVVIMPPLAISLDQLDQICTSVELGIQHATAD